MKRTLLRRNNVKKLILLIVLNICFLLEMKAGNSLIYFFDKPAYMWEVTLPLGNGRIDMTPDGGIEQENIVLNESSVVLFVKEREVTPPPGLRKGMSLMFVECLPLFPTTSE